MFVPETGKMASRFPSDILRIFAGSEQRIFRVGEAVKIVRRGWVFLYIS